MGGDHQAAQPASGALQTHLVDVDVRPRKRGPQQRAQLRDVPFPRAEREDGPSAGGLGVDLKRAQERTARRDHLKIAIEQDDGRIGGGHQGQGQGVRDDGDVR